MVNIPVRATKQRQLILYIVRNSMDHPSSDIVYERALAQMPNISLGTVYRNLAQLVAAGQVRQIAMPNGPDRYDGQLHKHYHIVCEQCGELFDFEAAPITEALQNEAAQKGMLLHNIHLVMHGICLRCQKKSQS